MHRVSPALGLQLIAEPTRGAALELERKLWYRN